MNLKEKSYPLEMCAVAKSFKQGGAEVCALRGVDLKVEAGEFVAIMGASGSGKSTLLHAAAGLSDVDSGEVLVDGKDLAGLSDKELTRYRRDRIGLVFQAFNLIPALTAEDNILLPVPDGEGCAEKLNGLLERLGIAGRRKHKPDALSGGEQQRVAIARALITDPAILLTDEPTGSLDSVSGQELCQLLRELCEEGRTIIMVTHEPAVAMWADRVVVLKDGKEIGGFRNDGGHHAETVSREYLNALKG